MTIHPITAQQAHTKLIRIEDDLMALIARLKVSGFDAAADEVGYIVDECLDPIRTALGDRE